ncbi:MAG: insulinase family protein [Oscillospiraceae bacterium]|nr:insulinase family protein [Oscillospiraceae bacterium]
MDIQRRYLDDAETIALTVITDEKFKLCGFRTIFLQPVCAETASADSLLSYLLEDTNEDYPDVTSFNSRLAELYGAEVSCSDSRSTDHRSLIFSAWSIDERYALEGEKLPLELLKLMCGCIFRPVLEDGLFPEKQFKLKQERMIEDINAEINDKRGYLMKLARAEIFKGEPNGIPLRGTVEQVAALTPKDVYDRYVKMLADARIEIFYAGKEISEECIQFIKDSFVRKSPARMTIKRAPSPLKEQVSENVCELDVTQSKMVMAFKYPDIVPDLAALRVFDSMFGSAPFSLLFKNVREKLSLCYYCATKTLDPKHTYLIDSGLESHNIQAARDEIMKQLDVMKNGEFSDELMEQSKLMIKTSLRAVEDFPFTVMGWYADRYLEGKVYSPAQMNDMVEKVTREDVIAFANALKLDTVYILDRKNTDRSSI